jgi:hypothetical protein
MKIKVLLTCPVDLDKESMLNLKKKGFFFDDGFFNLVSFFWGE